MTGVIGRTVGSAAAALLIAAVPALGHAGAQQSGGDRFYKWGEANSPTFSAAMKNVPTPTFEAGPCTETARRSMPAGPGHDHLDINQHRFQCSMRETAFLSLAKELTERPDLVFGEMDVKGDLAAAAVAYPESGFVLFDVSDSASPKFLSWYRGDECEGTVTDVNCGAFVDLSPDGKRVYISVQSQSVITGQLPNTDVMPLSYPGVDVVDISDRTAPKLMQKLPYLSVTGVHTTRSFEVPGKGEYVVSVANLVGATIGKVVNGLIVPVHTIKMDDLHDTFVQQDPLTGKTLLYTANGYDTGFFIYDISTPESPVPLAEWDITPECANDWYAHTIDITTVNGRRIVVLANELIDMFGEQPAADQDEGCGEVFGNGDYAGPVFIVDATDFSKMGAADAIDDEAEESASDMKAKSEATLITTWSNAANRAGGRIVYTPHNQQIVGNHIYLSAFHAGVTVLDATEAFQGRNVRPKEIGVVIPTGSETRPIHPDRAGVLPQESLNQFFTSFIQYRPTVWDMQWHKGRILVSDMVGGLYSYTLTDEVELPGSKTKTATKKKAERKSCRKPKKGASRAKRRAYAKCKRKQARAKRRG